jgi:molybdopterin synthase sulfur carrier subunit
VAVTFIIPGYLQTLAGGLDEVRIAATPATLGEALEELWRLHPALHDRVLDERGAVREHINVFVGKDSMRYSGGLSMPVPENTEILIVPAVSGG